jgi:hypothetical protein
MMPFQRKRNAPAKLRAALFPFRNWQQEMFAFFLIFSAVPNTVQRNGYNNDKTFLEQL